jgi:hypothetical protein
VQEAGEEVRVVDLDGKLDQDVLESEFRLLDAAGIVSLIFKCSISFSGMLTSRS